MLVCFPRRLVCDCQRGQLVHFPLRPIMSNCNVWNRREFQSLFALNRYSFSNTRWKLQPCASYSLHKACWIRFTQLVDEKLTNFGNMVYAYILWNLGASPNNSFIENTGFLHASYLLTFHPTLHQQMRSIVFRRDWPFPLSALSFCFMSNRIP